MDVNKLYSNDLIINENAAILADLRTYLYSFYIFVTFVSL